jgi:hypothetical protein
VPGPVGRPTKLTPERQERIVTALRAGNYLTIAAEYAGVNRATVFRWLAQADEVGAPKAIRDFRDAVVRARAEAEHRMVDIAGRAAAGGTLVRRTTRTLPDGSVEVDEQWTPPDGRVALDFLGRAFPDRWSRRTEVTGADGGPVQMTSQTLVVHAQRISEHLRRNGVPAELPELPARTLGPSPT